MLYKIAHLDDLYAAGGFYDSTVPKESLIQTETVIQLLAEIYPGGEYRRIQPRVASSDPDFGQTLRQIFDAISRDYVFCAPSLALQIDKCYLFDNVLYIDDDCQFGAFYPTYRANDRPYVRPLDHAPNSLDIAKNLSGAERRLIYLGSAGSFNYGHWLVDDLPRLKWLIDDPRPTTIVMQSFPGMDAIRAECVNYLAGHLDTQIEFITAMETVTCHNLTYVTPVSFHPYLKNPAAMRYLREAVRLNLPRVNKQEERVYIKRRQERGRSIENSRDVEQLVKRKGFVIIDPEEYSFTEQAAIFAQAKIIIGTMCAAMCNSIFSDQGTKIVYLTPTGWIEPFYWDLASTLGHSYTAIYGTRAMTKPEPHFDDFSIEIEALKAILREMI